MEVRACTSEQKMTTSQRHSVVTAMSVTSSDFDSVYEVQDNCARLLFASSLSTERGKVQKTCQLIWLPLLPVIALLVYSSFYLVRDVRDYTAKVGQLHNSRDIEAAAGCLESIRHVQTLRYTSTLYLSSGSAVHSFELYVDDAFSATVEALSAIAAAGEDSDRRCDFEQLVNEYFSEMNFGQTDVHVDDESLKNYCTLADFILDSLDRMRNLTVSFQNEALEQVSSTFSFLIDLMLVDCMKNVAYYGNRLSVIRSVDRYHALVDLDRYHALVDLVRYHALVDLDRYHALVDLGRYYALVDLDRYHALVDLIRYHALDDLDRYHALVDLDRYHALVDLDRYHAVVDLVRYHALVDLDRYHALVDLVRYHALVDLVRYHALVNLDRYHALVDLDRYHGRPGPPPRPGRP